MRQNTIPMMHLFLINDARAGSSAKKERIIPKIPENIIKIIPHPKAAFTAPKGAFLIIVSSVFSRPDVGLVRFSN